MKILYHHRIASKDGQYVHIEEIIASLRKLGHEVIVCEPDSIQKTQFGKGSGVVDGIRAYLPGFIHELAELLYSIPDFFKLRRMIKQHQPDCIYERYNLYFISGIWASRRYKLPILMEVNAPLYNERANNDGISLHRLAQWSELYCWRKADCVLPVTRVLADIVSQGGVPEERLEVIPNGINAQFSCDLPSKETVEKKYNLEGKLVLGFTGFVRDWHRLDRVLTAIAHNSEANWHLFLVGDGPDRLRLESLAKKLGVADRMSVTGVVGRLEIPAMLQCFDVALQPDVVAYASPLKVFEYMALAKPILAPDSPNIREILTDENNCLLFQPGDNSFSRQLIRLCKSEGLRQRLGYRARESIDEQSLYWDTNAEKIVSLFEGVQ